MFNDIVDFIINVSAEDVLDAVVEYTEADV